MMPHSKGRALAREFAKGGVFASVLLAGAVVAGACTQIDAPTKLASYYQRYTEMRDQIMKFDNLRREVASNIENFVPNIKDRLDMAESYLVGGLEDRLNDLASEYGVDVAKATSMAGAGDLIGYAGRNVVGDNDPCLAAALGLGRDVAPSERVVSECASYFTDRALTPDSGSGGVGPNAGVQLNGMLASASGNWPILNLYREDLAWAHDQASGGSSVSDLALDGGHSGGNSSAEIAGSVGKQMRLGGLIVGQGGTSVSTRDTSSSGSKQTVAQSDRLAQAGRNAYAVESIAREAATTPRITTLREQLDTIDIDNLDQMTEGQRYAARLSALAAVQEVRTLLQASRLRHEQLEGVLLAIDAASSQERLIKGAPL